MLLKPRVLSSQPAQMPWPAGWMAQSYQFMNPVERLSRRRAEAIIIATRQTSRMLRAAFAALSVIPAILLTGCLTMEPPGSANTITHSEKTFSAQPVPPSKPIQLTLGPTTRDRAEVVIPIKPPQKAAE